MTYKKKNIFGSSSMSQSGLYLNLLPFFYIYSWLSKQFKINDMIM